MTKSKWDDVAYEVDFNLEIDRDRFEEEVDKHSAILDFGCGYGRVSNQLFNRGYANIHGVESSRNMIERGKAQYPNLRLQYSAEDTLPFPADTFDAVVSCAVFTCIDSPAKRRFWMDELRRVLKPGGVLHLVEFTSPDNKTFTPKIGVPMWYGSREELAKLIGPLHICHEDVKATHTMGGNLVRRYSAFARKMNRF